MRYRKLDADGDFSFGHGLQDYYVDVPDAVRQAILTRLNLYAGEFFADTTAGVPWLSQVTGYGTGQVYDAVIKAAIAGTQGVLTIDSYTSSLDRATRMLSVTCTVTTIYGVTALLLSSTGQRLGFGIGGFGTFGFGR